MNNWNELKPGDPVYVNNEVRPYRVRCRDDRYIICTKPYNPKRTVMYFIVDLKEQRRGPDNMVFCSGYETQEDCEERLKELQTGQIEVSRRRDVPLELPHVMTYSEIIAAAKNKLPIFGEFKTDKKIHKFKFDGLDFSNDEGEYLMLRECDDEECPDYNWNYRCWDAQPSQEQMENTPWKEDPYAL